MNGLGMHWTSTYDLEGYISAYDRNIRKNSKIKWRTDFLKEENAFSFRVLSWKYGVGHLEFGREHQVRCWFGEQLLKGAILKLK